MQVGTDEVIATIERIYDAALDAALWPDVLDGIADLTGSECASLILQDKRTPSRTRALTSRVDEALVETFMRKYMGDNANLWTEAAQALPCGVVRMGELVPTEDFVRTAFYHECERPLNVLHNVCAVFESSAARNHRFSIFRSAKAGPGEDSELHLLGMLAPHMHRATAVAARLDRSVLHPGAALSVLERLPHGVMLLGEDRRVRYANLAAEAILSAADGLTCRDGELSAVLPADGATLEAALALGRGGPLAISRRHGGHPYIVVVAPAGMRELWPEAAGPATLLFITDTELGAQVGPDTLRQLYGLTPAESGVALEIADGRGLPAAARNLGVSPNTAQTHLKSVFRKTGVNRQAALAALLARLPALH